MVQETVTTAPHVEEQPAPSGPTFVGVEAAAKEALIRAKALSSVSGIILALGIIGSIIFMIVSIIPVCPPLQPGCYNDEKGLYNFMALFPTGIASLLSVLWLNNISETIASRSALAAEVAKTQLK